jgi:protocadherin delta 1
MAARPTDSVWMQMMLAWCTTISCLLQPASLSTPPLEYSIVEEVNIGAVVGNLLQDGGLSAKYSGNQTALSHLRFKLLNYPEPLQIEVDERSGQLRTITRIDRESMCAQLDDCALNYDVAVQPMAYFQILKVVIRILDINDNTPMFSSQYLPIEILETSEIGSSFSLHSAFDPDSPQFGIKRYRLHPPYHPTFELQYELSTSVGVPDVVKLILIGPLDYEAVTSYQLELVAVDGGDIAKNGRLPLDIVVVDDNDNAPRFDNATYEKHVMESLPVGSTIDRVKATDADSGIHGTVTFALDAKTLKQYGNIFTMEANTGALVLRSSLDYEQATRYILGIVATDGGSSPHTSYAQFTVNVQDVNDNAPDIRVNTLTAGGLAEVDENSEVGYFVAHVSVVDLDSGEAGKVTCSLSNDDFNMIFLFNKEYKIVTSRVFDHELQQQAEVTVTCRDHGWQQLKSSVNIQVAIVDRNDNAPKFESDVYTSVIEEGNEPRAFLIKVSARDADSGANGAISYFVDESSTQYITVDEKSGIVRARTSFDYERQKAHEFRIFAADGGNEALTATATFVLTIIDTNDERPRFKQDRYKLDVKESVPIGTDFGQVSASDADTHPFDRFQFRFEPTSVSSIDAFQIDPRRGIISTQRLLDRETTAVYYLTVVAYSDEVPFYSSTASVTVVVTDVNDNAPRFTYPTERNNTLRVSAASPVGRTVCTLRAVDPDEDSRLTFGTEGQADGRGGVVGLFGVDPEKGSVVVSVQLQQYVGREFTLRLLVWDNGDPQRTSRAELRVIITNDPLPVTSERSPRSLLASESLTVVLTIVLIAVVISILIIAAIVVLLRKRRHLESRAQAANNVSMGVVGGHAGGDQHVVTTLSASDGVAHSAVYEKANYMNGRGDANGTALAYSTVGYGIIIIL